MLRTLGGKNIGKCRLRAHQHPLLPPLPNRRRARSHANIQGKTRARVRDGTRAGGCAKDGLLRASILDFRGRLANRCKVCPFIPSCVHRFLISGSNLRIDAGFSPETPSSVHRFLISGPDLRIDARFSPETAQSLDRLLISGLDLGINARFSPETPSSMHRFLISGGEFGNHCSTIVAAVRNCPPAAPVAATNFRDRF